ncbi:MAG: c-type cytochrome biogenesis protein CcmI [Alphaproteobacteria bacterium]
MIWVLGSGLTLGVLVLLLRPLFAASTAMPITTFDEGQAEEARTAAARRLLAQAAAQEQARPLGLRARNAVIALVAVIVPALGLGLYGMLGHPQKIAVVAPAPQSELAGLADQLGQRLREQGAEAPAQGWALYARTLHQLGRYSAAAEAYQVAAQRDPENGLYISGAAEASVFANEGQVSEAAVKLFRQALALTPGDPAARYYLALADLQAGRAEAAYGAFLGLAEETSPTAPYFGAVQDQLALAAQAAGKPLPEALPESPGPSADDVAAAADMSAEDRMAMIRGMVDGLAARLADQPDDLAGWQRLARARMVLREWAAAAEANLQVLRLAPGDVEAISALKSVYPRLASGPLKDRVSAQIQ